MNNENFYHNRRVLVTGGTGFAGSHLVERLLQLKSRVVVLSRGSDPYGYFASEKLGNRAVLAYGNVKDEARIFDIVSRYEISLIFHLAAQPIVTTAYINPKETLETNIMGTVNVLEAARRSPLVEGVIVASSDKAYGKLEERPYMENDALRGDHPYDVSKSAADLIANTYKTTYNLPVAISRFGNIYGEGDLNPSRVIPGIIESVIQQKPFIIRSNGLFVREYLYVKDVVDGYLKLGVYSGLHKDSCFNFGSGENHSVLSLIALMEQVLGVKISYTIANTVKNEIPTQHLVWDKARAELGWEPRHKLAMVLPKIYSWYEEYSQKLNPSNTELSASENRMTASKSPLINGNIFSFNPLQEI